MDEVLPELEGGLSVLPDFLGGETNYDTILPKAMPVEDGLAEVAALADAGGTDSDGGTDDRDEPQETEDFEF